MLSQINAITETMEATENLKSYEKRKSQQQ